MRAFLALPLPEESARELFERRLDLRNSYPDWKWIPPFKFHITLQFLGEITEAQAEELSYIMERAAPLYRPFTISTTGPGQFPPKGTPRVIYEGIGEGGEECRKIQRHLQTALLNREYTLEKRRFHPHITLCRLPFRKKINTTLHPPVKMEASKMELTDLVLFRSTLKSHGAEYEPLAGMPLGG